MFPKDKPAKYGHNIRCLNEVRFPYLYRCEVYGGKPADLENSEFYTGSILEITWRLLEKYGLWKLSGCNLYEITIIELSLSGIMNFHYILFHPRL